MYVPGIYTIDTMSICIRLRGLVLSLLSHYQISRMPVIGEDFLGENFHLVKSLLLLIGLVLSLVSLLLCIYTCNMYPHFQG